MFYVFFLIFAPRIAWEKIAGARRSFAFILGTHLLPFIALVTIAQGWTLMHWGKWQPKREAFKIFSDQTVVVHFEILQAALFLAVVLVSAVLLHFAAESFHGRKKFLQSFTVIAYGFSPMLLAQLLDLFPKVMPWVSWPIGAALTIWILYQAVPRVLQPVPVHAFGNYLAAVFILVLLSGLVRIFTAMFLLGSISFHRSAITRLLGIWLGQ